MIESQIAARVLPSKCREAVKVLLQEVYGYEDFFVLLAFPSLLSDSNQRPRDYKSRALAN